MAKLYPHKDRPLNRMLLDLSEVVPNALFASIDDRVKHIADIRSDLEAEPNEGPIVRTAPDDDGVYRLATADEGYPAGYAGEVYEDQGLPTSQGGPTE